jgi:hypothetical protein
MSTLVAFVNPATVMPNAKMVGLGTRYIIYLCVEWPLKVNGGKLINSHSSIRTTVSLSWTSLRLSIPFSHVCKCHILLTD